VIDRRGILAAAGLAITVTGAHAVYRAWPAVYGTEVYLPAALIRQAGDLGLVSVQLAPARIALDVPHKEPPAREPFEAVQRIGSWWIDGGQAGANERRLRGRPLYLQLIPGSPLWSGGPVQMRTSTVSDAPIESATNIEGVVTRVSSDGYLWLDFSLAPIALPGLAANLPANTAAAAIMRVLPSGRAVLVGVVVNGTRY